MAGISAGWWLASRKPAAPARAILVAAAPQTPPAPRKPQVKLIRAAARKVTEIDVRDAGKDGTTLLPDRLQALAALRAAIPGSTVEFDPITGAPSQIQAIGRFLTDKAAGLSARGVVGGFIDQHAALFGHGSSALKSSRVTRDDVTQHSGMTTIVWNQEVEGVPVFKTILKANITKNGELITIDDHFVADPTPNRAAPAITAEKAISLAAGSMQSSVAESSIVAQGNAQGAERQQQFSAPGISDISAQLTYLPMNEQEVRLGWDVTLFSIEHNEMFRTVVDAETGAVLYRSTLTSDISNATYRVYGDATSKKPFDSPMPMMPGHATPQTTEPAEVPRQLVTLPALDTTASPNGWINDGGQETLGNNVDAHADTDANNSPDLPRPNGGPTRTFDAAASLSLAPSTYKDAATVNLFYVCNWVHDRLYQLGFTESAGNFQTNNFDRGGLGNDAIQADAQDGSGTNNANFSTPPDGSPGRLQMYVWTPPDPDRDSALDTHLIIHEYTHGLSNRLVGGGVGISAWQSMGLGEGWSDFYALCLTSDPSQDPNAVYPMGPYSTHMLSSLVDSNYYFGIRRYPYCTDMTKSPLTFKDIDYRQASTHVGVPLSPRYGSSNSVANQVHAIGEVWCGMLWDVRAALIAKRGSAAGNERVLQLVTDAMKLSPANPNFIQARDAILQADLVLSGGADVAEITSAFARRGLGMEASSPTNGSTDGVVESFDLPDALKVTPLASFSIEATRITGPIFPATQTFTLKNTSTAPATWVVTHAPDWLSLAPGGGTLAPGASVTVQGTVAANVINMPAGTYEDSVTFTNTTTGVVRRRPATLKVNPLLVRTAFFNLDTDPMWAREGEWALGVPTGTRPQYGGGEPSSGFTGSNVFGIVLTGTYSATPGGYAYLTSGPINTTGMRNVTLSFRRWLNQQVQPAVYATVDVSNDGINWTNVWQNNSNDHVIETGWSRQTYALGALADDQPTVYVRWGHRVAMPSTTPMGGWNIDDIEFLSETTSPGITATTQSLTTAVNTPVAFTLGGVNAGNPAAPQVVNVLSLPSHGTLTGTTPNLVYTPDPGFSGVETIPFTITSEGTTSTPACVVFTVLPGPPDASVEFPDGTELADGSGVADFGPLSVGLTSQRQFLIKNVSGGPLNLLSMWVDGAHAFEFTLGSPAKSLLAPGESTYLPVTWAPRFVGAKQASLHIRTNDPDEDSYDIVIHGTGTDFDGGVRLTRDISTGSANIGSLLNVRGNLMFIATSSTGATTLWTSQGTPETTVSAEDVMSPGTSPGAAVQLTVVGSRASFYNGSGSGTTIGLWNSDGTLGGSYKYLADTTPFFDFNSRPIQLTALGETLFFSAGTSATQGAELWKSNGTSAGTVLVKEINPTASAGSAPASLKAFNGLLWFTATDGTNGVELWKSDGTAAGTVMVKDIEAGANASTPLLLSGAGSTLFFSATTAANGRELYKSDGTAAGTVLLKDFLPGASSGAPTAFVPFGNVMLFSANDVSVGQELFRSDGTAAGTVLVKDIRTTGSSASTPRLAVNDIVYLTANDDTNGTELWKTDGTAAGTVLVKDIYAGTGSSSPTNFVQVGNLAYFTATTAAHGAELWRSDGTEAGTVLVSDLNAGTASSTPASLTLVGSRLYFTATVGSLGTELFVLDVGPAPEIFVEMVPGLELATTGATLGFDPQPIVNGQATRTLLIKNLGTQPLFISEVAISGADAASFTLSSSLAGTQLAAGRGVVVGVTFNPATAGAKAASLQIISNDLDEPVFDITLTGSAVTAPEIVVERSNGAGLLDDVSSVMIGDAPQGLQVTDSFTVRNVGSSTLALGALTIDGADGSSFSASGPGVASLSPGASTSFSVTFSPAAQRAHRAALHLASSDADEASFDIILTGIGSFAPGPLRLRRDIHRQGAGLVVTSGAVLGSTYYFAGNTAANGTELWRTDGTPAGTVLVKDILPGTSSGTPTNFTPMNGLLYFTANDGTNGTELWSTDGTSGGTVMVKNINAGSASSTPSYLVTMNGVLYFTATEATTGAELWRSDGTSAGTVLVKEFITGTTSGNPMFLTVMNNTLYFAATDTANGSELWKSDGTAAGTVLVKDINATAAGIGSSIANLRAAGNQILFTAKDGINGNELWRSDGTGAGTWLVADISPGTTDSAFFSFTISGSYAYFMTSPDGIGSLAGPGQEIWRSDGTLAGTFMLADIRPGYNSSTISSVTPDGFGGVYFSANNAVNGFELWRSDGSCPGTQMVKDINPGSASSSPTGLSMINGLLYFSATTSAGAELWRSDGSDPGTFMLREMNAGDAGGSPSNLMALGGQLIFNASNGGDGQELWAMAADGTDPRALRDATPGSSSSNPAQLNVINDKLCFMALEDYTGTEWWVEDGTGPRLLKDIKPGTASGVNGVCRLVESMQENATLTRTLFFVGDDGVVGGELWRTDGTTAGTYLIKDIFPGSSSSTPNNFVNVSGRLFFAAASPMGGNELWTSDGTEAGTHQVANINLTFGGTGGSFPANLTGVGATVFFAANDGVNGTELWKSDGGPTGTVLVKDITPGGASTAFGPFSTARGLLFFSANDGSDASSELWVSDGTTAGTFMLLDINATTTNSGSASISSMIAHNNLLIFNAHNPTYGNELWCSDGTTAGTVLLKDINPGTANAVPSNFKISGGTLFFTALTTANGLELWKTDGTTAGTVLVKDIFPGTASSVPSGMADINGTLYLSAAASSTEGAELWKSDGTSTGTQMVVDVRPGSGLSSSPANITLMGTRLFFSATGTDTGVELFSYNLNPTPKLVITPLMGAPLVDDASTADFGMVTPGQSTSLIFKLANQGDSPLVMSTPAISGTHGADFTLSSLPSTLNADMSTGFSITFTPSSAGVRTGALRISSNDPVSASFDVALTGRGLTNYEAAAQEAGLPPAAENSDPHEDYDGDGVPNMLELAFGTPATTPGGGALSLSGGSITSNGQPIIMKDSGGMHAVYLRRRDAASLGITYSLQFSANLGLWEVGSGVVTVIAQDSTHEAVSVPFPANVAGQPARFFRVTVDLAP